VPGTTNPVTNYNKNYSNRIAENVKAPNKKIAKTEHSERGSKENKQAINRMSLNRSNIASTTAQSIPKQRSTQKLLSREPFSEKKNLVASSL
jgi:hypothetical protein